jgi:hypothetical protein
LIDPSMTQGAVSPSQRNAARKVSVRHRPKGALAEHLTLVSDVENSPGDGSSR